MKITLTRIDGGLRVSPAPPYIVKYLRYSHRSISLVGWKRETTFEERLLHKTDGKGGIFTLQGFFEHICVLIQKNNDIFVVEDLRQPMPTLDLDAVKALKPRENQIDAIADGLIKGKTNSGIYLAAGGFGKTYMQAFTYACWSGLNTILAIPLKQVFNQTYAKFVELFPNKHIGRVGDGYNDISKDITITTFKSLKKCALEKCELFLVDELQSAVGEQVQEVITSMRPRRIFGYTATDDGLFNNADKLIKGLFGERLIEVPYEQAQETGAVVPGVVYFIKVPDVIITANSIEGLISQGIKNCKVRNQMIAKVCTTVPKNWATLIFVDHIQDHLVNLYSFMPAGTKYLHRESSKKRIGNFALSSAQQNQIINEFSNNNFQFLIGTDAFRAGVDIPHLRVVIQASGGSSKVEVLQEALRGSRTLSEERQKELNVDKKTHFVLIDFLDNHHQKLQSMAKSRMALYKEQGWKIKVVDKIEDIDWYDYQQSL